MAHILGYHVTQFLLLLSRYFSWLAPLVGKWAWWLAEGNSEVVDEGYKVLNFDCLVSASADTTHVSFRSMH
jgi:L-gulonolactone oxidase